MSYEVELVTRKKDFHKKISNWKYNDVFHNSISSLDFVKQEFRTSANNRYLNSWTKVDIGHDNYFNTLSVKKKSIKSDYILARWLLIFTDQSYLPSFFCQPTILSNFCFFADFLFSFLGAWRGKMPQK